MRAPANDIQDKRCAQISQVLTPRHLPTRILGGAIIDNSNRQEHRAKSYGSIAMFLQQVARR